MATNPSFELIGPIPRGRPSLYSDELAQEICERLACGESLNAICLDEHIPDRATINRWLLDVKRKDFRANYAIARQMQADAFADEVHDIADNLGILPDHKRVMIDARKWRAARQNWRAWGDKVQHEHSVTDPTDALGLGGLPASLEFLAGGGRKDGNDGATVDS